MKLVAGTRLREKKLWKSDAHRGTDLLCQGLMTINRINHSKVLLTVISNGDCQQVGAEIQFLITRRDQGLVVQQVLQLLTFTERACDDTAREFGHE